MTVSEELSDVIAKIQQDHCVGCQYGKVLMALRDLRDDAARKTPAPAGAVPPATTKTAAPRAKLQKKTAKPAPAKTASDPAAEIRAFLQKHPNSKMTEIAGALGVSRSKALYRLRQMGSQVEKHGSTSASRWRLKGQDKSQAPKAQPQPGICRCEICNYPAHSPDELAKHIEAKHGEI